MSAPRSSPKSSGRSSAKSSNGGISAPEFDRLMRPLAPGSRLGVGVSGGADSVGLMVLLADWRDWREAKGRAVPSITILTVNHGLRVEAADEVRAVKKWAKALGFPHKALAWDGDKPAANIQAEARSARYRLLTDWCLTGKVAADLLTAHHLDDQAETFLMRLQRGSGVDGLSGMAPIAMRGEVRLLRPLLDVPRTRIRAVLEGATHPWIDDPSNEDERYLRVQVRGALTTLEELGLGRDRLISTAKAMSRARVALEEMCDQLERDAVIWHPFGFADADARAFEKAPDEIALRLLARLLKKMGRGEYAPRLSALEALLDAVRDGALGRGRTLGGTKLTSRGPRFLVMREPARVEDVPLELKPGRPVLWDGRFDVSMKKTAGDQKMEGGEVRAVGKEGVRFLSGEGIAGPAGVPKLVLETLPAFWSAGVLLAQPQLGFGDLHAFGFRADFRA